jgi:hypothetical protein
MRNSSTCFGKLTILSRDILNLFALGPLGIKLGANRYESTLVFTNCQRAIANLKLLCKADFPKD